MSINRLHILNRRTAFLSGSLLLLIVGLFIKWKNCFYIFTDDAFITLRYVRNFINGNGIVWNAGEYVEGYTSPLHVYLLGFLGSTGIDLIVAAKIAGIGAYLLILLFFGWYFYKDKKHSFYAKVLFFILVALNYPLIIWSCMGLETAIFAFMLLASVAWFLKYHSSNFLWAGILGGILLFLTAFTRPEGMLWGGLFGLFILYNVKKLKNYKLLFGYGCILFLLLAIHIVWRLHYYGYPLSNTYYAKGEFLYSNIVYGLRYLFNFFSSSPFTGILFAIAILIGIKAKSFSKAQYWVIMITTIHFVYILYVGADYLPAFRFIVPLIPTMLFLSYIALAPFIQRFSVIHLLGLAVILMTFISPSPSVSFVFSRSSKFLNNRHPTIVFGMVNCTYMQEHFPSGSTIGIFAAGTLPYFCDDYQFIDILGLNDETIAHREVSEDDYIERSVLVPGHMRGDANYVLSRKPDYILAGPSRGDFANGYLFASLELGKNRETLEEEYEFNKVLVSTSSVLPVWFLKNTPKQKNNYFYYYKRK